jgi:hypothetical protein
MLGSLFRANGFTQAQTRQIRPFGRAKRIVRSHDRGQKEGPADTARAGHPALQAPVIRGQIRRRRAADRRSRVRRDLSRHLRGLRRNHKKVGQTRLTCQRAGDDPDRSNIIARELTPAQVELFPRGPSAHFGCPITDHLRRHAKLVDTGVALFNVQLRIHAIRQGSP